ncbi:DUF6645 domain-containing protein, partial [Escherichia coli]|uniref:DUF6645 domain-containing protein n=1 Tax=Escherichia coli TaxID=562 RepID=UPI003855CF46
IHTNRPLTDFGGKTSIFSHPVYLFLREFSLQDFRGGSGEGGEGHLSSFFVQTDKASINVAYHHTVNQQKELGTFGAFDHDWHTLAFKFKGSNSINVTPVLDGVDGQAFDLVKWANTANGLNRFVITDITGSAETYPVLIDTVEVKANKAGAAA